MKSLYFPGLTEAIERVRKMTDEQLYAQLDSLYGRDNLGDDPTRFDLEHEAIMQTKRDFRDPAAASEWDYVETMGKIALAMSRSPYR